MALFPLQEQAKDDEDVEETIVIKTTAQKLGEVEKRLLEIQNLNVVPDSLGKFSHRACLFQFAQCIVLFYFASKSTTKWSWYTSFPLPEEDALSHPPSGPDPPGLSS